VNESFETPPELKSIEAMLEGAHPREAGFDVEETRVAQDRILFESGKIIGRQASQPNRWKAATAIMSGVAAALLFIQFSALSTEQPSGELAEKVSSNRDVLANPTTRRPDLITQEFDDSRFVYKDTDFEDDETYFSFLNLRSENVKRVTFNQEKDPS
jgi:hypothetical protein